MKKENNILNKSTYYYDLPKELIAQRAAEPRDNSRLLVYNRENNSMDHKHFYNIIEELNKGDVLVVNNTRVLPARLFGEKIETGAKIEVLLLKKLEQNLWEVMVKPLKRLKNGAKVKFSDKLVGWIDKRIEDGLAIMKFECDGVFEEVISEIGDMPLPHYIHTKLKGKEQERYQTVYSKTKGSSAAPTAGLHFTTELMQKLKEKGVEVVEVLLHVGLGTFRPVSEDNILNHDMHSEYYEITKEACDKLNRAKQEGRRVVAVGTTSVRVLESASTKKGEITPSIGNTNIFIYPGYKFKMVDGLITNFHLPESTLIMLVSAFMGIEETLNMYKTAVEKKYRFFSFGDSTFIK